MLSKLLQTLFVLIGLLFFTGIVGLYVLLMGGIHFRGLLVVVPLCLFVLFVCLIFNWLSTKKRKVWLAGIMGISLCLALVEPLQHYYKMSIPTVDAEIDVSAYQPFTEHNLVIKQDTSTSLQLVEPLPRLDGATAIYPLYAAFVEATYPESDYPYYDSRVMVSRTPEAYQNLISGEVDLIFVAAPSESQKRQAELQGLTFDMIPIGREAFVFFVNHKNAVENLTLGQVQQIYAGKITNWQEVGGENDAIRAFQRPADSGSQTALEKIMGDTPIIEAPAENVATGMGGIIHEVSQ